VWEFPGYNLKELIYSKYILDFSFEIRVLLFSVCIQSGKSWIGNPFDGFLVRQGITLKCNQALNILWACHSLSSCIETHSESHIQPATSKVFRKSPPFSLFHYHLSLFKLYFISPLALALFLGCFGNSGSLIPDPRVDPSKRVRRLGWKGCGLMGSFRPRRGDIQKSPACALWALD